MMRLREWKTLIRVIFVGRSESFLEPSLGGIGMGMSLNKIAHLNLYRYNKLFFIRSFRNMEMESKLLLERIW